MISSNHVLPVSTEPFISVRSTSEISCAGVCEDELRVAKLPEHTATTELKQPMFQSLQVSSAQKNRGLQDYAFSFRREFRALRKSKCGSESARLSMFSFSSEILEKHWEPTRGWRERLTEGSCRRPAQNLTEIPPRKERRVGATSSIVSPLLVLD